MLSPIYSPIWNIQSYKATFIQRDTAGKRALSSEARDVASCFSLSRPRVKLTQTGVRGRHFMASLCLSNVFLCVALESRLWTSEGTAGALWSDETEILADGDLPTPGHIINYTHPHRAASHSSQCTVRIQSWGSSIHENSTLTGRATKRPNKLNLMQLFYKYIFFTEIIFYQGRWCFSTVGSLGWFPPSLR